MERLAATCARYRRSVYTLPAAAQRRVLFSVARRGPPHEDSLCGARPGSARQRRSPSRGIFWAQFPHRSGNGGGTGRDPGFYDSSSLWRWTSPAFLTYIRTPREQPVQFAQPSAMPCCVCTPPTPKSVIITLVPTSRLAPLDPHNLSPNLQAQIMALISA